MRRSEAIIQAVVVALFVVLAAAGSPARLAAGEQTTDTQLSSFLIHDDTRLRDLSWGLDHFFSNPGGSQDSDFKATVAVQLQPPLGAPPVRSTRITGNYNFFSQTSNTSVRLRGRLDRNGNGLFAKRIPASRHRENGFALVQGGRSYTVPAGTSITVRSALERIDPDADPGCYSPTTLCVGGQQRFKVELDWRDPLGNAGPGYAFPGDLNGGRFFFFDPDNWEMVVKVLDGCDFNDHFWVFAGATTNVEYTLTVTDTQTSSSRTYGNELGMPAPAIVDTTAFATCP